MPRASHGQRRYVKHSPERQPDMIVRGANGPYV